MINMRIMITNNELKRVSVRVEGVIEERLKTVSKLMERRVRAKFLREGGDKSSRAGQYPRAIKKIAARTIAIRKVPNQKAIRLGYESDSLRHRLRLRYLESGYTITPKKNSTYRKGSKVRIPIPLTLEAKRFVSRAKTAAEASLWNFKPRSGTLKVIVLGKGSRKKSFLGTERSKVKSNITGQKYVLHFLLTTKKAITVKPRKGISDAFNAERNAFIKHMTDNMQKSIDKLL